MKTFLFSLFLIANLYPQWNDVPTSISESNLVYLENFANKDGIHIVIQASNSIKYYKINTEGTVLISSVIESGGAQSPSISGANNALYISYKHGSNIVTKKYNYSNGNWDAQLPINIGSSTFNGLDNIYDPDRGLHLVFSANGSTHYYRYPTAVINYTDHQEVSNQANEGLEPTITLSSNKVHVGFRDMDYAKTRDKNLVDNYWDDTQEAQYTFLSAIHAGTNKLFSFSLLDVDEMHHFQLFVNERNLGSISWAADPTLISFNSGFPDGPTVTSANTNDLRTHIIYFDNIYLAYLFYEESEGWTGLENIYNDYISDFDISSYSNDLFVILNDDNIKFRHYDVAPLAPQNLSVSQSQDNHPYFTWSANKEPDISSYKVYRNAGSGPQCIYQTTNTYYEDVSLSYCTAIPPATCPENNYVYHVTAVDLGSNESSPSNTMRVRLVGAQEKANVYNPNTDLPGEFFLDQNYPNPFNPITQINYAISEDAKVQIKVYDILGTEVAELVNEVKPAGYYEATFDASSLTSGVYIYRITALKGERILFSESKQMILVK